MPKPMKTLTVAELIARLQQMPPGDDVRVWLPGSTIALSNVFKYKGATRIEGDVDPGSALDTVAETPPAPSAEWPRHVPVNGPTVLVEQKTDRPRALFLSETVATTTSGSGEQIEIVRSATGPFFFQLRGEKLTADIDISAMIQEALLHVLRENA